MGRAPPSCLDVPPPPPPPPPPPLHARLAPANDTAPQVAVRINPLQTQLAEDDITAIFARSSVQPSTIVVPKVDSADDLEWLFDHVYTTVETAREDADVVDLLTQVESPIGLLNLRSICEMDSDTVTESLSLRMNGLIFGSDDYCAAVGVRLRGLDFHRCSRIFRRYAARCRHRTRGALIFSRVPSSVAR